jgi:hypothetical protein
MERLIGYLARFCSIFSQGELLCTQGLAYLLKDPSVRKAFAEYISEQAGRTISSELTWRAEVLQQDGGRVDLEACTADERPVIKIEAKLGAAFGKNQLRSYMADLQRRSSSGLLLVLAPRRRAVDATASVSRDFALTGTSPWRLGDTPDYLVAVIYWEEVLEVLSAGCSQTLSGDLAQFHALYQTLIGSTIIGPTTNADLLKWRDNEDDYINLVDLVTRRLTQQGQVLPMGREGAPNNYQRRYVCLPLGTEQPCFSIGVCDPFDKYKTPFWLRFHRDTPNFSVIQKRLFEPKFSEKLLESGGHIWMPLDVPLGGVPGESLVDSLVEQAEKVMQIVYLPLR